MYLSIFIFARLNQIASLAIVTDSELPLFTVPLVDAMVCSRLHVQQGDWFRTKKANMGRCWMIPPSKNDPCRGAPLGPEGTFIGPVHNVDETERFIAVLVPHPHRNWDLPVWVNVWTSQDKEGRPSSVYFCDPIPKRECDKWRGMGWIDHYMPPELDVLS
jgi:hypothetical protein